MILALNETRKTLLASRLRSGAEGGEVALDAPLIPGEGILLDGSASVRSLHRVDVVALNGNVIVATQTAMLPQGAIALSRDVTRVLVLPSGTIPASQSMTGDRISFEALGVETGAQAASAPASLRCGRR